MLSLAQKITIVSALVAFVEARFGQEQEPVAAVAALGNAFGEPGEAATLAGAIPGSLLAAAGPCAKLSLADQIAALGDDPAVLDAAIGLVSAETNFNPFAVDRPFVCGDASLPATEALRGITPLVDPAVTGSADANQLSDTSIGAPFDATGLSQAEVLIAQGFNNFQPQDASGANIELAGGAAAGGAAGGDAAGGDAAGDAGDAAGDAGGDAADGAAGDDAADGAAGDDAADGAAGDDAAGDAGGNAGGNAGNGCNGGNAGNGNAGNGNAGNDNAGDNAGDDAGNDAGDNAGDNAGDDAGNDAGDNAGDNAGDDAGNDAGDNAGDDNAGGDAGGDAGGAAGGAADFGDCTPTMDLQGGRNGRAADELTFLPTDPLVAEGQQEALNPNIITNRICDQLTNVCNANADAVALCEDAQAQIEALGTRDQTTADTWNGLLGF